jgi:hypothetical protein
VISQKQKHTKSPARTEAAKAKLLLGMITAMTGLSLDDMIKEVEGTSAEKAKAQLANMIKMSNHMKINPKSPEDLG